MTTNSSIRVKPLFFMKQTPVKGTKWVDRDERGSR
jgi:hypothetical protein